MMKLKNKPIVISAADAITAKLVEEAGFHGIWASGFEISSRLSLADNGTMNSTDMLLAIKPIIDAVKIPVFVDVDEGYGTIHNTIRMAKDFQRAGVYAICIEDNIFPKTNSLWDEQIPIQDMEIHGAKIKAIKEYAPKLKVIARTEALIRGYGIDEAIKRGEYYAKCGADYVLLHSRDTTGKEALEMPKYWKSKTPLMTIPTKCPQITNKQLFDAGYKLIIWGNISERLKIKAIREGLKLLKKNDCPIETERGLSATLDDLRGLTPINEADEIEKRFFCDRLDKKRKV